MMQARHSTSLKKLYILIVPPLAFLRLYQQEANAKGVDAEFH